MMQDVNSLMAQGQEVLHRYGMEPWLANTDLSLTVCVARLSDRQMMCLQQEFTDLLTKLHETIKEVSTW